MFHLLVLLVALGLVRHFAEADHPDVLLDEPQTK